MTTNPTSTTYTKDERDMMLRKMRAASEAFYYDAVRAGCHPFLEFTGLMNEYIKLCHEANEAGIDFTETSGHGSGSLPMKPHHVAYLSEKLACIYGNSARDQLMEVLAKREKPQEASQIFEALHAARQAALTEAAVATLRGGAWRFDGRASARFLELADRVEAGTVTLEELWRTPPGLRRSRINSRADYNLMLAEVARLMSRDPQAGTPEATRLSELAAEVEAYEQIHWPIGKPKPAIHILHEGRPLCEFSDLVPGEWPPGQQWIALLDWEEHDRDPRDCPECCERAKERKGAT